MLQMYYMLAITNSHSLSVGLGAEKIKDVRHTNLQLVSNWRYPRIVLVLEYLLSTHQVQLT